MTFDEIFTGAAIGAIVSVSNGAPAPPPSAAFRYACWRSHNFSGALLEKIDADGSSPRRMLIQDSDPGAPCSHRAFEIREDVEHSFAVAP